MSVFIFFNFIKMYNDDDGALFLSSFYYIACIYAGVKSLVYLLFRADAMIEEDFPDLLPKLRPYQRRAAYWMVQREKGDLGNQIEKEENQLFSPLCLPVELLNRGSKMFYNPFRYFFLI